MIDGSHPFQAIGFLVVLALIALLGNATAKRGKEKNAKEYFLGGRGTGVSTLAASLFITAIAGMWLTEAYAGSAAGLWNGIGALVCLLVLGLVLAPFYFTAAFFTLPQVIARRFDTRTSLLWAGVTILFYVGVKIPLVLTLATWTIEQVLGWDAMPSITLMVVVVLTGLYTVAGGFTSVIHMQVIQAGLVLAGSFVALLLVVLSPAHASVFPATMQVGGFPSGIFLPALVLVLAWHWFADQYTLQRVFSAPDQRVVRKSSLWGAALLLVEIAILYAIRTLTAVPGAVEGTAPVVPMILRGIAGISFLALLMATLSSDVHSTASLFTLDYYRAVYPGARDESLVLIGRLSTTMIVVLAILAVSTVAIVDRGLIALLGHFDAHVAPPLVAVLVADADEAAEKTQHAALHGKEQ